MDEWIPTVLDFITLEQVFNVLRAVLLLIVGYILARLISMTVVRTFRRSLDTHRSMLVRRGTFYIILGLFFVTALLELGFNLSVLLGTAGILTVAVGFASQTSMSNLISGLFLVAEEPFKVGDLIQVGTTLGEVLSIDSLSVKLRKFDNTYVRIPNELIVNTEVLTFTKFPIRRLDLQIGVAYKEDIGRVRDVLMSVAEQNPLCLEEPEPLFIVVGFGDSAINLQFSVWAQRENYLLLKNSIQEEIKRAFDREDVEIPFPHRTLYTGSVTEPFPVQVVNNAT